MFPLRSIQTASRIVFLTLLLIFLVFFTVSFPIGVYVSLTFLNNDVPQTIRTLPLFVFGLAAPIKSTINALTFIALLLAFYLSLVYIASKGPSNLYQTLRLVYSKGISFVRNNTLIIVCTIFPPLLLIEVGLEYLQGLFGVPTGALPKTEPLLDFALLTYAPIAEEIGFRLTLIGIVSSWIPLYYGDARAALHTLWRPSAYINIENTRTRVLLSSLIIFSSLVFGLAHVLYGGGWELGKIFPSFVAGLCLGWLYVEFGFHAAVLLHFLFNYFAASFDYFTELVSSTLGDAVLATVYLLGAVVFVWLALRALSSRQILGRIKSSKTET
jgi:membrane protease YdiL (CAAX protease family)